ncbi:MAG: hypothetical protein Ta2A_11100 [Treponemataceae bacterium]|nr:MAG: hypothetical protein Ta2A_11100 [Treponemataceae bacterium]
MKPEKILRICNNCDYFIPLDAKSGKCYNDDKKAVEKEKSDSCKSFTIPPRR